MNDKQINEQFPEQDGPSKIHGTTDDSPKEVAKMNSDPDEGHTREWQDRARVVLDTKEAIQKPSADKQSPDEPAY